ncbi:MULTISPECIES: gamma-glutamylcyclotransferase family protein [unclassified Shimia]|uniref:gamma-glutamylcyclotransferase family protein n=1 Tax=unclassified Shimia TaxID=2630038 RepID=UPI003105870A
MNTSYFFGFGSLVNTRTHPYADVQAARLSGWRRTWRHTELRPIAFLTVEPAPNTVIDGVIAHVPNNDWVTLDAREYAYDRVDVTSEISHKNTNDIDIALYAVPDHVKAQPDVRHPILLSYLDVVVQGYAEIFGKAGVENFFETTTGWDVPVIDDRSDPIYPRHQTLSASDISLVDQYLAQKDITFP